MQETQEKPKVAYALGFIRSDRAWYARCGGNNITLPEIHFGIFVLDGGKLEGSELASATMRWVQLDAGARAAALSPHLEVYSDGWSLLPIIGPDLAARQGSDITDDQFVEILTAHHFSDFTAYTNPHQPEAGHEQ